MSARAQQGEKHHGYRWAHHSTRCRSYWRQRGWQGITPQQVFDMPSVFIGTVDEIIADLVAKRQRFGFSYMVVPDSQMESIAPIVARLTGC